MNILSVGQRKRQIIVQYRPLIVSVLKSLTTLTAHSSSTVTANRRQIYDIASVSIETKC